VIKIGIVTVTFNSAQVLPEFIESIKKLRGDWHLYCIDSGSSDGSLEILEKSNLDNLTIISFDENIGIAKGNNEGISYAMDQGCQKILLINNDVTFGPELLNELTEISISENAQLVVPKILFYKNDTVIWCAGGYFNPKLGYASIHRGEGEIDRGTIR